MKVLKFIAPDGEVITPTEMTPQEQEDAFLDWENGHSQFTMADGQPVSLIFGDLN